MTVVTEEQAAGHIHGICLKTGPPRRVGVELEWLVRDARDPALPVPAERVAAAVAAFAAGTRSPGSASRTPASSSEPSTAPSATLPTSVAPGVLPSGALLTAEPGGQLELSSLPADSLTECIHATSVDLAALRLAAADAGLELAGIGLDPHRQPLRVLEQPRYAAMEAFFDAAGPWGRQMMCATASVQVCLDAGDDSDGFSGYRRRWRLVHAIGPVLVGAFANSPLRYGRPTGWRSSRQQVWWHMPADRTRPPMSADGADKRPGNGSSRAQPPPGPGTRPRHDPGWLGDDDPRIAWADYALDATVMCVRDPDSEDWSAPPGLTFRDWVRGEPNGGSASPPADGRLRPPTADDLAYHLTTLFPPVRPRGHFELRMIDAQPGDGWVVPLAVTAALMSDESAGEAALAATSPLWSNGHGDPWLRAARLGPADPALARASRDCFAAARSALDRMGVPASITDPVDDFMHSYVSKDRCPADDLLEEAR